MCKLGEEPYSNGATKGCKYFDREGVVVLIPGGVIDRKGGQLPGEKGGGGNVGGKNCAMGRVRESSKSFLRARRKGGRPFIREREGFPVA